MNQKIKQIFHSLSQPSCLMFVMSIVLSVFFMSLAALADFGESSPSEGMQIAASDQISSDKRSHAIPSVPITENDSIPTVATPSLLPTVSTTNISPTGIELIKRYESCRLTAYKAIPSEKYYTIGWGHYGAEITEDMEITQEEADAMFLNDIKRIETYLNSFLSSKNIVVNQNQYDALISFTYNLGSIWTSSKYPTFALKEYLINGPENYTEEEIREAFTEWCHAGGNVLSGLVKRRNEEASLFLSKVGSPDSFVTLTAYAGKYKCTADPSLNLRNGPGTKYDAIAKIPYGAIVTVTKASGSTSTDWANVTYNGKVGYASMGYLEKQSDSTAQSSYKLTFQTDGGTEIKTVTASTGSSISLDSYTTTRNGYTFKGWYSDSGLTSPITVVSLTSDTTVYAAWTKIETTTEQTPSGPSISGTSSDITSEPTVGGFTDVHTSDWFASYVLTASECGWMKGTSDTAFSPNATTTRGMIVTILYRMQGSPATGSSPFADVENGSWYEAPIAWASSAGIVSGYSESSFGPNDPITREQIATILYNFAAYLGYDTTAAASLEAFPDAWSVSSYAASPMQWAVATGLLNGKDGCLVPQGKAIRSEAATLLVRFSGL